MLTITLDEELSAQIADAAAMRGEEANQVAVDILKKAFAKPGEDAPAARELTSEAFLASLTSIWEEQERRRAEGRLPTPEGNPGDVYELKLAHYYGEEYDRQQGRMP